MLPDHEGRFKANIIEHNVAETGPNKLATLICRFGLLEELVNGQWMAFGPEEMDRSITGYFYLEKRDGSINTITIDSLKAAFGWNGRDPLWLADADFTHLKVQVKLEFELYNGKTQLKVRHVDPGEASPAGVQKADEQTRRSLSARLGSKLRALAGGSPSPAPMPQGKPSAATSIPPVSTTPAAPKPPSPVKTATMRRAWEVFVSACPTDWDSKEIEAEWFRVLEGMFPGSRPDQLNAIQWQRVIDEAPGRILPF